MVSKELIVAPVKCPYDDKGLKRGEARRSAFAEEATWEEVVVSGARPVLTRGNFLSSVLSVSIELGR